MLTQKIIFVFVNLVIWVNVVPMCLNIPLSNLLKIETFFNTNLDGDLPIMSK